MPVFIGFIGPVSPVESLPVDPDEPVGARLDRPSMSTNSGTFVSARGAARRGIGTIRSTRS